MHWQLLQLQGLHRRAVLRLVPTDVGQLQALLLRQLGQHGDIGKSCWRLVLDLQQLRGVCASLLRGCLLRHQLVLSVVGIRPRLPTVSPPRDEEQHPQNTRQYKPNQLVCARPTPRSTHVQWWQSNVQDLHYTPTFRSASMRNCQTGKPVLDTAGITCNCGSSGACAQISSALSC